MFYEYALDPDLISNLPEMRGYKLFMDQFGFDRGRLIARYPRRWQKRVWDSYNSRNPIGTPNKSEQAKAQMKQKGLEVILNRLRGNLINRGGSWDHTKDWLENALDENQRTDPFQGIITVDRHEGCECIFTIDDATQENQLWNVPCSDIISRKADDFAAALKLLLSVSKEIIFFDPYFHPNKVQFINVLKGLMDVASDDSRRVPIKKIQLHTSNQRWFNKPNCNVEQETEDLIKKIEKFLSDNFPEEKRPSLKVWKERNGGEKIHNRYILTEWGGVSFGIGLDEGRDGQTDDIARMSKQQHEKRWGQLTGLEPAFELVWPKDGL
ncbi:MAG: hypothetical protein ABIG67_04490 [Pseudomonadota bacterium]